MAGKIIPVIGLKRHKLTAVSDSPPKRNKAGTRIRRLLCSCECGGSVEIDRTNFGKIKSCGCLKLKHGNAVRSGCSYTYRSWSSMNDRCNNPNSPGWPWYGGSGVSVCERWKTSFNNFLEDMGERPSGATIDRIDGKKGYEPGNCRWSTRMEQAWNRCTNVPCNLNGVVKAFGEWCHIFNAHYSTAYHLVFDYGVPLKPALEAARRVTLGCLNDC